MIITYIHSNWQVDKVSAQTRCRNLADAINRTSWRHRANLLDLASFAANDPSARRVCGDSDLLVIHRHLYGDILGAIQYWKARDKKVIVDFDQPVNFLTREMPGYAHWFEGAEPGQPVRIDPPPIEQFHWGLGMVDAATVSSERLADDWARYTNVHKIADYLNTHHYPAVREDHGDEVWIGLRKREDVGWFAAAGLFAAIESVCAQRPNVKIFLHGEDDRQALPNIPAGQLKMFPPVDGKEWAEILPSLDFGLLPLGGDYDLRLGSFAMLEFMISKVVWIASGESTPHHLSHFGIWTQNDPKSWELSLLQAYEARFNNQKKTIMEPYLFALNQDVRANIESVLKVYANILLS